MAIHGRFCGQSVHQAILAGARVTRKRVLLGQNRAYARARVISLRREGFMMASSV